MTTKRYYFTNDSHWVSNGCDCCEDDYMECYNLDNNEHPDVVQNGSAYSVARCMRQVLEWEGVLPEDWQPDDDMNWGEEELFLQELMDSHGLQIVIQNDYDDDEVFP